MSDETREWIRLLGEVLEHRRRITQPGKIAEHQNELGDVMTVITWLISKAADSIRDQP